MIAHLRTYPPKFGLRVAHLFKRFVAKKEPLPESVINASICDGMQLFSQMEWGDWWSDANMKSVFVYLRGSTDLELGEWRALFPTLI